MLMGPGHAAERRLGAEAAEEREGTDEGDGRPFMRAV
jgi:hypothetical protein